MREIWETRLSLANASEAVEHAIEGLKAHCRSINQQDGQYYLDFEVAIAVVRSHEGYLSIHVEAQELDVCHGTKMMIISHLNRCAVKMPVNVLWIIASESPFAHQAFLPGRGE